MWNPALILIVVIVLFQNTKSALSFDPPDKLAKDCMKTLSGDDLIYWCVNKSLNDYDPQKLGTNVTTLWESCCQILDELTCYEQEGQQYCPKATYQHLKQYAEDNMFIALNTICLDPGFQNWIPYCRNLSQHSIDHMKQDLNLELPEHNGPEKSCIKKMEQSNKIEKARKKVRDEFIHKRNTEITTNEQCCATYKFLEIIWTESLFVCDWEELTALFKWINYIRQSYSHHLCRSMPCLLNGEFVSKTKKSCEKFGFDLHNSSIKDQPINQFVLIFTLILSYIFIY